ncbi:BH0509 family protein [Halalkalibacter krulwichiae]|nr:BH0509 family protein [Halalkalibacter krulwichiae]
MNKSFMIFVIVGRSRWSEEALMQKTDEEIEKIYNDVMEKEEANGTNQK